MNIGKYVVRRLLFIIPLFFGITLVIFALTRLAGDPVELMLAEIPGSSQETINEIRAYLGLDKPLHIQYLTWLWHLVHFDLGTSYYYSRPVNAIIGDWLFETLKLQLASTLLAIPISIFLGVTAATNQNTKKDYAVTTFSIGGISTPAFLSGIWLIIIFGYYLGWFPSFGAHSLEKPLFGNWLLDAIWHMVLPCSVLIFYRVAIFTRLVRTSMLEVLRQDYVLAARASGLGQKRVIYKHALRNALIPFITFLGLFMSTMISGAPITETVFSWPGLGYLFVKSLVDHLDFPVITGVIVLVSITILITTLVTDVAYALVDPRIKLE